MEKLKGFVLTIIMGVVVAIVLGGLVSLISKDGGEMLGAFILIGTVLGAIKGLFE